MRPSQLAIHQGLQRPQSRRGVLRNQHVPVTAKARLLCFIVKIGDGRDFSVGSFPHAFETVRAQRALPLKINDHTMILRYVKNSSRIADYIAAVFLRSGGSRDRADDTIFRLHHRPMQPARFGPEPRPCHPSETAADFERALRAPMPRAQVLPELQAAV